MFRDSAGAWQRQDRASAIYNQLREVLDKRDKEELFVAWNHYQIGEGRQEIDEVCYRLIIKYDRQPVE